MVKLVRAFQIGSCILSFLFIWGCAQKEVANEERARLRLQIGTSYLANGKYPEALRELLIAERLDPTNPAIQNNLGLAYFVRERFNLAERHIRKAIKLNPKYTEARNNLGRVLIELKLYKEATKHLSLATQDLIYPYPERAFSNLGIAYFLSGKYDQAKENLLKSLQIRRTSCHTMNYYARSLYELKSFGKAAEASDSAIGACKDKGMDEPHFYAALSYMKLGKRELAKARLEEILDLYPGSSYRDQASTLLQSLK